MVKAVGLVVMHGYVVGDFQNFISQRMPFRLHDRGMLLAQLQSVNSNEQLQQKRTNQLRITGLVDLGFMQHIAEQVLDRSLFIHIEADDGPRFLLV